MLKDYIELVRADKPIGTLLLLWPTLGALFVAAHGIPPVYAIVTFSVGVFLTRSAGCAINDVLDAEFDKHVQRTATSPITCGRISKRQRSVSDRNSVAENISNCIQSTSIWDRNKNKRCRRDIV